MEDNLVRASSDEDAAHGKVRMDDFRGFAVHVRFPIGIIFIVEEED